MSQDTKQSLWDPIVGSRGHPGSGKIQLFPKSKFSPFPSQICPTKRARRRAQCFFATPKPACGGPCGQTRARMPPTVTQDTTESVWDPTLGTLGHPGSGNIKKNGSFAHFRGPEKNTSASNPRRPENRIKSEIPPKMRLFHRNFPLWNPSAIDSS